MLVSEVGIKASDYGLVSPTKNFWQAMLAVKKSIEPIEKNAKNPAFGAKSKYADLSAVIDEVIPKCHEHGLDILQLTAPKENENTTGIVTLIVHAETGEGIAFVSQVFVRNTNPQEEGKAITYLRRYSLKAAFCMRDEDDDGNSISNTVPSNNSAPTPNVQRPLNPSTTPAQPRPTGVGVNTQPNQNRTVLTPKS